MVACSTESTPEWQPLDLMAYGAPIDIMAPDSADVKSGSLGGLMKDITVQKGEDFNLQILVSPITAANVAAMKSDEMSIVKSNRYFAEIIEETDNGFIYKTAIDSNNVYYGFRYLYQQGNNEFMIQQALGGKFTEEEAKKMYEAVVQNK